MALALAVSPVTVALTQLDGPNLYSNPPIKKKIAEMSIGA